jgi:type VI secretion system secreted protein Hcp
MALPVYIEIEAETQGKIEGGCTRKGREKMIEGLQVRHNVEVPTEIASGLPTGNVVHGALTFVKDIDKSSPLLFQALTHSENVKSFIAHFWQVTGAGKEVEFYKVTLTNAHISSITTVLPNVRTEGQLNPMEEVALRYETITWTILDGNIEATASWQEPSA